MRVDVGVDIANGQTPPPATLCTPSYLKNYEQLKEHKKVIQA